MAEIRFVDGGSYERAMGIWSRSAGEIFLDWLTPRSGLTWADIGCGSGAFTELLVDRCAPAKVLGLDPSAEQLTYARTRHTAGVAEFTQGSAMELPFADKSVDAAAMALVIFFVPEPPVGVAEMVRITRPGGLVAAYAWDMLNGGFPWDPVNSEFRRSGIDVPLAPRAEVSEMATLRALWQDAGLQAVETRAIVVQRAFNDFDDLWNTSMLSATMGSILPTLDPAVLQGIKDRVRAKIAPHDGPLVLTARANAAKGVVPT